MRKSGTAFLLLLLITLVTLTQSVAAQTPPPTNVPSASTIVATGYPASTPGASAAAITAYPVATQSNLPAFMLEETNQTNGIVIGASLLVLLVIIGTIIGINSKKKRPYIPAPSEEEPKDGVNINFESDR